MDFGFCTGSYALSLIPSDFYSRESESQLENQSVHLVGERESAGIRLRPLRNAALYNLSSTPLAGFQVA